MQYSLKKIQNTIRIIISGLLCICFIASCDKEENNDNSNRKVHPVDRIQSVNIEENEKLELNTDYSFYYQSRDEIIRQNWVLELFTDGGETIEISAYNTTNDTFHINLPNTFIISHREDYAHTADGMLKAQVLFKGFFTEKDSIIKSFDVKFPYKPRKPTIEILSIVDHLDVPEEQWNSDVTIVFSSFHEVTQYILKKQAQGSSIVYTHTISGNQNTYFWKEFGWM